MIISFTSLVCLTCLQLQDNISNCCAANTDGIDITSCQRVLIENSTISTGDDCVCMKNRGYGAVNPVAAPTRHVLVRNMNLLSCSCPTRGSDGVGAFKLGTQLEGGVSEVIFEDSRIGRAGYALKLDSPFGQPGYARNVTWRNISIDEAEQAIFINAAAITARPLPPPPPPPAPGAGVCKVQTQLSHSACIEGKTFGCFPHNNTVWAGPDGCGALFDCGNATGVKCGGNWYAREYCPCVTTTGVFINVSDLRFIDIVGHNIGEPTQAAAGSNTSPAVINQIRSSSPSGATKMFFQNITLTNRLRKITWQVEGMSGVSSDVSPPLDLDGVPITWKDTGHQPRLKTDEFIAANALSWSDARGDDDANQEHLTCAGLSSTEQFFSSFWGAHHFLRFKDIVPSMQDRGNDPVAPSSLGIPAFGYRMYSDRSLDLHHGAGLWLSLLKLGVKASSKAPTDFSVANGKYLWRPDFVNQSGEVSGRAISQQVYYVDSETIAADFAIGKGGIHSSIVELIGLPNPANTFVSTRRLGWSGSALHLGVTVSTNLTHGAGGTAAGCIAAKSCEPLTLHAVVSVSVAGCDGPCANLTVSSVCASPPPPPKGAQCKLTEQGSHLPCVQQNKTNPKGNFGCFPANKTMWLSGNHGESSKE